ncbi:MAG: hypothetical protein HRT55_01770 [Colwellia sp.]|uniref:hypothetical protein n=2 Tax=Alteromonadales TaxID=135622 RepID=UPI0025C0A123|nr:hypothetical protein [Colwellia sp.]NQZ25027.1 hypothetical protein [Colwellia sp.]
MERSVSTIIIFLLLLPISAHAEVMDKEPSLQFNFIWGIGGSIATLLCARYKPKFLPLITLLPLFYFYALWEEINDPHVGPQILREAGEFYIHSAYALGISVISCIPIGLLWFWWYKQHNKLINKD